MCISVIINILPWCVSITSEYGSGLSAIWKLYIRTDFLLIQMWFHCCDYLLPNLFKKSLYADFIPSLSSVL